MNLDVDSILRSYAASGTEVEIVVSRCLYTCCGGGWHARGLGTWRGKILEHSVTDDSMVVRSAGLGKISSVLVELKDLRSIEAVNQED